MSADPTVKNLRLQRKIGRLVQQRTALEKKLENYKQVLSDNAYLERRAK